MVKQIPVSQGETALVSDVDGDLIKHSWYLKVGSDRLKYAHRGNGKNEKGRWTNKALHREVMERIIGRTLRSDEDVDHIDGNGLNNARDNLRVTTASQNCANRRVNRDSKSGYKGVTWNEGHKKWEVSVCFHKRKFYLGSFTDKHEAARAYNAKAYELHGQYARLNMIDERL